MLCLVVSHQAVCCVLYVQVRGLVEQTQEWEALYSCTARDNVQVFQYDAHETRHIVSLTSVLLMYLIKLEVWLDSRKGKVVQARVS